MLLALTDYDGMPDGNGSFEFDDMFTQIDNKLGQNKDGKSLKYIFCPLNNS